MSDGIWRHGPGEAMPFRGDVFSPKVALSRLLARGWHTEAEIRRDVGTMPVRLDAPALLDRDDRWTWRRAFFVVLALNAAGWGTVAAVFLAGFLAIDV